MAEAALSPTETALENQRIGSLQLRVAALCTLVQICDGYDINSIGCVGAVADPQLAPAAAGVYDGISVVEHRHHGRRPVGGADRRPLRAPTAVDREPCDLRPRLAVERLCRLARDAERSALFYRARDRRRVSGSGDLDRRLCAAPAARDDDHGELYRGADRRLSRRPDRGAAAAPRLSVAGHLFVGRGLPIGAGAGDCAVAA